MTFILQEQATNQQKVEEDLSEMPSIAGEGALQSPRVDEINPQHYQTTPRTIQHFNNEINPEIYMLQRGNKRAQSLK